MKKINIEKSIEGIHEKYNKDKSKNHEWFLSQAKVILDFVDYCWSVCISLTLVNGETNVDEPPVLMIPYFIYFQY